MTDGPPILDLGLWILDRGPDLAGLPVHNPNPESGPRIQIPNPRFQIQDPKANRLPGRGGCCCWGSPAVRAFQPAGQWRAAYDSNIFRRLNPEEMADSSGPTDSTNLLQRWLTPRKNPTIGDPPPSTLVLGSNGWRPFAKPAPNPQADAEFQSAFKLFQQGKFAEAERQFAKIAKEDRKGTTWGENAQFYLAESQYQQKKFVTAHDSFDHLHTDYPATAYLDKLFAREYELAQFWLAQTDPKAPADKKVPWFARFDSRLPLLDSQGQGLKSLEHVRQYQPDGPLADDATIQIADFHMKHQDYESAALYYDQFIAEYGPARAPSCKMPSSPRSTRG